ncbi:hypothetical protein F4778DRAFT_721235 [Xylariomycetidae sp. FL2044]|nr:hypothetical protein F4778DRAFT_721235 [Xylariomycetidae sp. FL2044]
MDDQFNGRTDDDLFADDFEPVNTPAIETHEKPHPVAEVVPVVPSQPAASSIETPGFTQAATVHHVPKNLSQSRHAKPAHQQQPRHRKPSPKPAPTPAAAPTSSQAPTPGESQTPTEEAPTSPVAGATTTASPITAAAASTSASTSTIRPGSNTALADRLASGANPRTKLTEGELAAKMEKMRILNAEKTRRFEQAEQDSRSHALAYEKGMEEARKRRAEEAERRRRGEEERRRMDEERAANRERKLKAMGSKEGGSWDEGKGAAAAAEDDRRGLFRSANGGVRGTRMGGGIAGSRFAEREREDGSSQPQPREFSADEFRGRGRGRGRGGMGRGGGGGRGGARGGYGEGERGGGSRSTPLNGGASQQQREREQAPPTADDFPALPPSSATTKLDTSSKTVGASSASAAFSPALNSPPIGKWDDEMAALDAKAKGGP